VIVTAVVAGYRIHYTMLCITSQSAAVNFTNTKGVCEPECHVSAPEVHIVVVPCHPLCAYHWRHQPMVCAGGKLAEGTREEADPAKLVLDLHSTEKQNTKHE
jgi:hypothetical protein